MFRRRCGGRIEIFSSSAYFSMSGASDCLKLSIVELDCKFRAPSSDGFYESWRSWFRSLFVRIFLSVGSLLSAVTSTELLRSVKLWSFMTLCLARQCWCGGCELNLVSSFLVFLLFQVWILHTSLICALFLLVFDRMLGGVCKLRSLLVCSSV